MSISTFQSLLDKISAPNERLTYFKLFGSLAFLQSSWTATTALPGAAPTTAAVPTNATTGALGQQNGGANALRMVAGDLVCSGGIVWLSDRLSHQGGLDATVTTAQTTNLPTAALTRYTTGDQVLITVEVYTQIGATGTTISASYTNQAGTSGRTTPLITFGGTNFREVGRSMILPFQAGDTGARSVESVTVTATTGTAGAFGVTLVKPLVPFLAVSLQPLGVQANSFLHLGGFMPEVLDNACLYFLNHAAVASAGIVGDMRFSED